MELDLIKLQTTWNDAASSLNTNFSKIKMALASRQGGGESPVIGGIIVNGMPYTDDDGDGFITLPDYPKKLSAFENDLNLGSFAYKNALAVSDIPDLSGKYLPLTGGTITGNGQSLLVINRQDGNPVIQFQYKGAIRGLLGFDEEGTPFGVINGDMIPLVHLGNIREFALPLDGYMANNPFLIETDSNISLYAKERILLSAQANVEIESDADVLLHATDELVVSSDRGLLIHSKQASVDIESGSNVFLHATGEMGVSSDAGIEIRSKASMYFAAAGEVNIDADGLFLNGSTVITSANSEQYGSRYIKNLGIPYTDNLSDYNDEYEGGVTMLSNTSGASIGNIGVDEVVLNIGPNRRMFGRFIYAAHTNPMLYFQTTNDSNSAWGNKKTIAFTDSTVDKAKSVVDANGNALNLIHTGNANRTDTAWRASKILFPQGTSSTWNVNDIGAYNGITILNAVQAQPEGAPDPYAVGLAVSGYYGFTLASLGGGDVLQYRRSNNDWKTIAFMDSNVASADYASNAGTLGGVSLSSGSNTPWGTIPMITKNGWMDVGKHFEFHYDNTTGSDFSTVLSCTGNHGNFVNLPSASGTLALLTDNVASATKLATARTIWGQSFDGTGNVSGGISNALYLRFTDGGNNGIYRGSSYSNNLTNTDIAHKATSHSFYDGGGILRMLINSSGNVTIGSSDIAATISKCALYVNGRVHSSRAYLFNGEYGIWRAEQFTGNIPDTGMVYNATTHAFVGGNVLIDTTTDSGYKLDVNGTIASRATDTSIRAIYAENSSGGVALYVAASGNRGLYDATNNKWVMYTNGTNAIFPVGNIGIGISSPAYKLDVAGTGRFTGKVSASGGIDIPNGQQLAFLDASGNRHTIAWDSASNGILIDGNLIVLGELATGLPMQEIPSIPEIGV